MHETVEQNWSVRALQRQINSLYYERLLSSQNKQAVRDEAEANTQKLALKPEDVIKDPYILESVVVLARMMTNPCLCAIPVVFKKR